MLSGSFDARPLVAALLLACGGAAVLRLAHTGGPYRAGPWPGLTARGAGVLLGCAAMLAGGHAWLGPPQRAMPDLVLLAAASLLPLALATRVVDAPGAASAACGAYLLPRSLASLADSALEPPPVVLVGALAFDLALWLRRADLELGWPRRRPRWRKRVSQPRRPTFWRGSLAGAVFAVAFVLVEPAYAASLGTAANLFSLPEALVAGAAGAAVCALVGALSAPAAPDGRERYEKRPR